MRQFLSVTGFSVLMIALFAGYSNYGIPQIEPAPPPKEEVIDLGAMTMDQFVALGERVFNGKGTCTLCHNSLGRAPELGNIGQIAPERLADARYEGAAKDIEAYLFESLRDPSAFVVEGFGKAGTGDTISPMPDAISGGVSLSEPELTAVVAYLQDSGGAEITVAIPTDLGESEEPEEAEPGAPREPILDVAEMVAEWSCDACHIIKGEGGDLGPDLSTIGADRDAASLRRSILDPNAEIAEGYDEGLMPEDMGAEMYASELEILVDFLVQSK